MADEPAGDKPATPDKPADDSGTSDTTDDRVVATAENPDAVKRALEAERKTAKDARKRAEAAEAKLAEREEADKSELEKAQGKVGKAEERAAKAEAALVRFEVAADKKVPAEAVDFLKGNTREELEASADQLLELVKKEEGDKPDPDFDGGARKPAPENKTPEQAHGELLSALFGGTQPD